MTIYNFYRLQEQINDRVTNEALATVSGDLVSQMGTGSVTEEQLVTTSGDIVAQMSEAGISIEQLTTTSGDIINQIPSLAGYATQSWVNSGFTTNAKLTTASGDIISQIPSLAPYATITELTTTSGDVVAQIPSLVSYATLTKLTTTSGDIVSQIPSLAPYTTLAKLTTTSGDIISWVNSGFPTLDKLTTTSGDIIAQIPSLAPYATQSWTNTNFIDNSEMATISGDIEAKIPTLQGVGGIITEKVGNVWNVDGTNLIGAGGGGGGEGGNNTISGVAGEQLLPHDVVYESISDGKFYKAFNNGTAYQADAIGMVTSPTTIEIGAMGEITLEGSITYLNWNLTPGKQLYVGTTSGTFTDVPTTTSGQFVKPVAQAMTSMRIWFHPELGWEVGGIYDQVIITQQQGQKGDPGPASVVPGPQGIPGPQVTYISLPGTAGEALSQYDVVYQDYTDSGKYKIAVCSNLDKTDACGMVIESGGIADDAVGEILIWGYITNESWSWTPGKNLFLSNIPGEFVQDKPTTSGYYAKPLGRTPTTSGMWFNAELGWYID